MTLIPNLFSQPVTCHFNPLQPNRDYLARAPLSYFFNMFDKYKYK